MISVCIPTYNGERFIYKQINSILLQLSQEDEIIISDDSSTDKTINIIKSFLDKRIHLLTNNTFKNPTFNLENALNHAKGDYIFLADQDDIWKGNKVAILLKHLANNDLVLSNCNIIDENDKVIHDNYYQYYFQKNKPQLSFFKNLYKNPFLGCAMAFNRKVMDCALPFPKKIAMHDIWIGNVSLLNYKIQFIEETLFSWRRHNNNLTFSIDLPDNELSNNSLYYKIKYRLVILYYLFRNLVFKQYLVKH
ncbi:MAG: glycosyltransferase family 2 protein [Bacteroidetes bacterium]|nr:glycosyltransferase family 2 protein [Bacteroidota bacterium]